YWKKQGRPDYQANLMPSESRVETDVGEDELFDDAVKLVVSTGNASISMVQRRFRIGYARAARLIDMMELAGIVGPYQGSKPREVLVSPEEEA
ncbi:MAG: DNA translocase FtsK, partial [Chitinophagales bacterium]